MPVKLASATLVSARDLNDGEIAVLEDPAACFDSYRGDVVQRHNDKLVVLGKSSDNWFHIDCSHRFRVLRPGETLMITEN